MPLPFAAFAQLVNDVLREQSDFVTEDFSILNALTEKQNMVDLLNTLDSREKFVTMLREKRDKLRKSRKPNADSRLQV